MFMNIAEAAEEAEKLDEIQKILSSDGFLCSAYFMVNKDKKPESWNLAFYSEEQKEITAVKVTEEGAEVGVTDAPLREDTGKIKLEEVDVSAEKGLERIKEVLEEEYSISYEKILFTLRSVDDGQEWRGVFVGENLSIVSIAVNTKTGEVTEKEKKSMSPGKSLGG
ncbi:MAG: hypothetical protein ACLFQ8_03245 [Candidatus Aenigmatarchaeota archaeon]